MTSYDPAKVLAYTLMSHVHRIFQMECAQSVREMTPPEQRRETLEHAAQELKNEHADLKVSLLMTPRAFVASALPHLIEHNERGLVTLALETILDTKHYQPQDEAENPLSAINPALVIQAADYLMQKYEGVALTTGENDLQVMHRAYGFALDQMPADGPAHSLQRATVQSKLQQLAPHIETETGAVRPRAAAVQRLRVG